MVKAFAASLAAAFAACALAGGGSAAAGEVSTNWSGYAATGTTFSVVRGSWVQPAANCLSSATDETDSSFWVGLGGYGATTKGIEQIGTDSDCAPDGSELYVAWYELWPASSQSISLTVSPGDRMSALVRVTGANVLVQLRNLSTGESFSKTLRMAVTDTSSAEWIAEAPSATVRRGSHVLPLTNFGAVTFSNAVAISAGGHIGTISDSLWTSRAMRLVSDYPSSLDTVDQFVGQVSAVRVVPTALSPAGGSFSVMWKRAKTVTSAPSAQPGAA